MAGHSSAPCRRQLRRRSRAAPRSSLRPLVRVNSALSPSVTLPPEVTVTTGRLVLDVVVVVLDGQRRSAVAAQVVGGAIGEREGQGRVGFVGVVVLGRQAHRDRGCIRRGWSPRSARRRSAPTRRRSLRRSRTAPRRCPRWPASGVNSRVRALGHVAALRTPVTTGRSLSVMVPVARAVGDTRRSGDAG